MGAVVIAVTVTERGRALAARLGCEHVHGDAAGTIRARWPDADGFVLFLAVGAAVRIIGPLLADKRADPAVVCVDEAARFAVAVAGGHAGGANALATRVAQLLGDGCRPVITTATDAAGVPALDQLPGFVATGDVAAVTTALLDGRPVTVDNQLDWPAPKWFSRRPTATIAAERREKRIVITDRVVAPADGVAVLHPPSLVVGVGASRGAPADGIAALVDAALESAGLARASVAEVATIEVKAGEPGIVALGLPLRTFTADALAAVDVPTPSDVGLGARHRCDRPPDPATRPAGGRRAGAG